MEELSNGTESFDDLIGNDLRNQRLGHSALDEDSDILLDIKDLLWRQHRIVKDMMQQLMQQSLLITVKKIPNLKFHLLTNILVILVNLDTSLIFVIRQVY